MSRPRNFQIELMRFGDSAPHVSNQNLGGSQAKKCGTLFLSNPHYSVRGTAAEEAEVIVSIAALPILPVYLYKESVALMVRNIIEKNLFRGHYIRNLDSFTFLDEKNDEQQKLTKKLGFLKSWENSGSP